MNDTSRALSALNHLDPSCPREEWVRIAMAAKAAELFFEDFHNWSQNADNYENEKDCLGVWTSCDESGGITAATLFYMAREKGWQDSYKTRNKTENSHNSKRSKSKVDKKSSEEEKLHAFNIWERCLPADAAHAYILRKQGMPDGLRYYPPTEPPLIITGIDVTGYLAIPCIEDNEIQTLQFIPPHVGKKLNLTGASFNNGYFVVGNIKKKIFLVESIGNAWATNTSTDNAAVVSFGSSRMMNIAKVLREKYPDIQLVIVLDRNKEKLSAEIAKVVHGQWVELPQDKPENYDVNDYALEYGYEALASLLADTKTPEMHYKLLTSNDLMNLPPMRWIVHGVVPAEGIAALYGPSGSGKSFLTLDMACAIATGAKDWFGRRVTQAPVVYVCLEGEAGVSKRIKAWVSHFNKELPAALRFIAQPFDLLSNDTSELAMAVITAGCVGGLVIIDTLNRASPGADENSSVDMGNIIAAAKQLQNQIGGLVLLVHHTGKNATKGLRGHSSLYASLDSAIEVVKTNAYREWSVAKSKDDVTGDAHSFILKVMQVGFDNDGEEITSCIVIPNENIANAKRRTIPPKAGHQKIIWDALNNLLFNTTHFGQGGAPTGTPCIRLDEAIEKTRIHLVCEEKRRTERTQTAITGLITKGLVRHQDGWLWLI
jgi:hypothetical protein